MRDVCQCESRGCRAQGGVQWDTRIIQKHRLEDQLKILEDAKADSERAVQEELDHISQHLAETTLADTPVHAAADDLCHRLSDLHLNPKSTSSENPSRRSAIRDVVAHLSEIEAAVASLRLKVAEGRCTVPMAQASLSTLFYAIAIVSKPTSARSPSRLLRSQL